MDVFSSICARVHTHRLWWKIHKALTEGLVKHHLCARSRGQKKLQNHPGNQTPRHKGVPALCTLLLWYRVGGIKPCSWALLNFPVKFWDLLWVPGGSKKTPWVNLEATHDPRTSFHSQLLMLLTKSFQMPAHVLIWWRMYKWRKSMLSATGKARGLEPCSLKLEDKIDFCCKKGQYKWILWKRSGEFTSSFRHPISV